jgi:hypothetical protein
MAPDFMQLTDRAIPLGERVGQKETNCQFIAFDFGICENESGELQPALVEMQGFPTLFGFQSFFPPLLEKNLPIPDGYSQFFNGLNREEYIQILRATIIGDERPEHVILLEIKPHEQKTRIDFYCTAELLNIPIVCISALITEGRNIYYKNNGVKTRVKRIYNRVIADELKRVNKDMTIDFDMTGDWDVEWIPHLQIDHAAIGAPLDSGNQILERSRGIAYRFGKFRFKALVFICRPRCCNRYFT